MLGSGCNLLHTSIKHNVEELLLVHWPACVDEKEERMHGGTLRALQMAGKKAPGKHPVGRARIGSKDTGSLSLLVKHRDPREVVI